MIGLPRAIAAWSGALALFPPELQLALGPWLQRLSLAMGPLRSRLHAGGAEPDGLDGVARTGSYERLLLSEWLLADEIPEEFARRAAMSEHLFLHLARREPAGAGRQVALFDAGPEQLGGPRVAQLAALLVLARRAERAGARFSWGVLQEDGGGLHDVVDERTVRRLLTARSCRVPDAAVVAAWASAAGAPDDLWLVGGPSLAGLACAGAPSRLVVEDVIEPGPLRLRVEVRRSGAPAQAVTLELPEARASARLVRDPFEVGVPARTGLAAGLAERTPLLFAHEGRRLLGRGPGGELLALHVPDAPGAVPGRMRQFVLPPGQALVAAGWWRRRVLAIGHDGESLFVHGVHGETVQSVPDTLGLTVPGVDAQLSPVLWRPTSGGAHLVFHDYTGRLYEVRLGKTALRELPQRAVALAEQQGKVLVVAEDPGRARVRQAGVLGSAGLAPFDLDLRGEGELAAFWARLDQLNAPAWGVLCARRRAGVWTVYHGDGRSAQRTADLCPPTGYQVIGVAAVEPRGAAREPGLVTIEPDRRTVTVLGARAARQLVVAPAPIVHAAASTGRPQLALLTEAGDLLVVRSWDGAIMARWSVGAGAGKA